MALEGLDPEAIRRTRHTPGPTNRPAAEKAFADLYDLVSLRAPVVEWLPSPLAAARRCRELLKANVQPIPYGVEYWHVTAKADSDLVTTAGDDPFTLPRVHGYALDGPLGGDPAPREVGYAQVQSSIAAAGLPDVAAGMRPGQFDDAPERHLRRLGGDTSDMTRDEALILRHRARVAIAAGPWWAFHGHVIVSDRAPQMRITGEGALESSTDFALRYADGWAIWAEPAETQPDSDSVLGLDMGPALPQSGPSPHHPRHDEDGGRQPGTIDTVEAQPRLAGYHDEWLRIASTTAPCDRAVVADVLTRLYRDQGLGDPLVHWVASPRAGIVAWHLARFTHAPVLNRYQRGEVGTGERRELLALADPFGFPDRWLRSLVADAERMLVAHHVVTEGSWETRGLEPRIERVVERLRLARPLAGLRDAVHRAVQSSHQQAAAEPLEDVDGGAAMSAASVLLGERFEELVGVVGRELAAAGVHGALAAGLASVLDTAKSQPGATRAMNTPAWDPVLALLGTYVASEPPPGSALSLGPGRRREIEDRLALARSGCAWWAFEDLAIIAEPPATLRLDDAGRLHAEAGPAIAYADGLAAWAWHGVPVPRSVIETPEQISLRTIVEETNQEVRRVMVDRMGDERLITESGARLLAEDHAGKLWHIPVAIAGDAGSRPEELRIVEVVNSTPEPDGTRRHYFLRVPPHLDSAHDAVAWTFGLSGREYAPGIES